MIDGRNFFWSASKRWYKDIWKSSRKRYCQEDDYTTGGLLDYPYFKEKYKLIAVDLSKQLALDTDRKAIQQINFTGNI